MIRLAEVPDRDDASLYTRFVTIDIDKTATIEDVLRQLPQFGSEHRRFPQLVVIDVEVREVGYGNWIGTVRYGSAVTRSETTNRSPVAGRNNLS